MLWARRLWGAAKRNSIHAWLFQVLRVKSYDRKLRLLEILAKRHIPSLSPHAVEAIHQQHPVVKCPDTPLLVKLDELPSSLHHAAVHSALTDASHATGSTLAVTIATPEDALALAKIQAALPDVPELQTLALTLEGNACTSVQGLEALAAFLSHIEQQPHGNVACHVTSSADMGAFWQIDMLLRALRQGGQAIAQLTV